MKKIIFLIALVMFSFNIFGNPTLNAPVLISPENADTNVSVSPTLIWGSVSGATQYEYQYSTSSSFVTYVNDYVGDTSATLSGLNYGYTYYWRVRALDDTDFSEWSEVWSFPTQEAGSGLTQPVLISPLNGAVEQELTLTLLWNIVPNANLYEYQYSTDSTFATYLGSTTQSSSISIGGLLGDTTYYWRIQATDGTQFSDWSEVWHFRTKQDTSSGLLDENSCLTIYPNPATDFISINSAEDLMIYIFDNNGRKIIATENKTINISALNSGTYVLIIESKEDNTKTSRIFVKK